MKIHTIGGYSEVGKNMTALELDNDVFILDCGIYLPPIVELEENRYTTAMLRGVDALPDDSVISHLKKKVKALLISHAHLDHLGALPYIANSYKAGIYGTPFTIEVLNRILADNRMMLKNKRKSVTPNSSVMIGKTKVEFINITHSTPQAALIVIHTPKGAVVYANDFKFDNFPILGKKPNYAAFERLGKKGVHALIVDSLYSSDERKTPSEKIARDLLEDVLLTTANDSACIIVSTFSSHMARLKSIVEFGRQMNREIVFIGRSLYKYVNAAIKTGIIKFHKNIKLLTYKQDVKKKLKEIQNSDRSKYMIVCTGHQGEEGSVLVKMARDALDFHLESGDHIIFASRTIPSPINIANKKRLEKKLKSKGTRIFNDVHVSGHAAREDLRDLVDMLKPRHIIPAHGDIQKTTGMVELATEMGYKLGKNVHMVQDGGVVEL